eukprot:Hpha_TRINITY_DN11395_c0_g1::TRINITY_DN11395_c0_g1_i1::g.63058::m.63058
MPTGGVASLRRREGAATRIQAAWRGAAIRGWLRLWIPHEMDRRRRWGVRQPPAAPRPDTALQRGAGTYDWEGHSSRELHEYWPFRHRIPEELTVQVVMEGVKSIAECDVSATQHALRVWSLADAEAADPSTALCDVPWHWSVDPETAAAKFSKKWGRLTVTCKVRLSPCIPGDLSDGEEEAGWGEEGEDGKEEFVVLSGTSVGLDGEYYRDEPEVYVREDGATLYRMEGRWAATDENRESVLLVEVGGGQATDPCQVKQWAEQRKGQYVRVNVSVQPRGLSSPLEKAEASPDGDSASMHSGKDGKKRKKEKKAKKMKREEEDIKTSGGVSKKEKKKKKKEDKEEAEKEGEEESDGYADDYGDDFEDEVTSRAPKVEEGKAGGQEDVAREKRKKEKKGDKATPRDVVTPRDDAGAAPGKKKGKKGSKATPREEVTARDDDGAVPEKKAKKAGKATPRESAEDKEGEGVKQPSTRDGDGGEGERKEKTRGQASPRDRSGGEGERKEKRRGKASPRDKSGGEKKKKGKKEKGKKEREAPVVTPGSDASSAADEGDYGDDFEDEASRLKAGDGSSSGGEAE